MLIFVMNKIDNIFIYILSEVVYYLNAWENSKFESKHYPKAGKNHPVGKGACHQVW